MDSEQTSAFGAGEQSGHATAPSDMVFVRGETYRMGSDRHYPEETPVHRVTVDSFWIDRSPVTNNQFAAFVKATDYVTMAERRVDPALYPGVPARMLKAGSLVFSPPSDPVALTDWRNWWAIKFGANWRRPYGPGSFYKPIGDHPVVHIAYEDAVAYAAWAEKDLPTEAEWEFAARGGLEDAEFAWGDEFMPEGKPMANTWHGEFPHQNTKIDGFERTSPVGSFPPNGYGLYDMIGNVWEWTSDYYAPKHAADAAEDCCIPRNPRNLRRDESFNPREAHLKIPRMVIKGGSHLCAPSYCRRYRPSARQGQAVDSPTSHIGFRCIVRAPNT
ncbi:MAG TPA: formylglycine-generating enzyme family protein [Rhizomicrobium sp.]|nr:formylglycine-generating enzyme family protein [Rhizomicrobium sp.]